MEWKKALCVNGLLQAAVGENKKTILAVRKIRRYTFHTHAKKKCHSVACSPCCSLDLSQCVSYPLVQPTDSVSRGKILILNLPFHWSLSLLCPIKYLMSSLRSTFTIIDIYLHIWVYLWTNSSTVCVGEDSKVRTEGTT